MSVLGLFQNVYAVLDLYGRITAVSIVSSSLMEDVENLKAPSLSSGSCSEGEEDGTPVREVGEKFNLQVKQLLSSVNSSHLSLNGKTVKPSVLFAYRRSLSPACWSLPS